jgi:hypothetical protein
MKVIFPIYFGLLFCILSTGCDHQNNTGRQNIRGVWRSDLKDSLLLVIYNKDFYFHERGRDLNLNYLVKRDSLLLFQDNIPASNGKLIWNSNDEFVLTNSKGKIRFTRVKSKVDTARLRVLVDWRRRNRRYYTYDEEYIEEHANNMNETQTIWNSISNASR